MYTCVREFDLFLFSVPDYILGSVCAVFLFFVFIFFFLFFFTFSPSSPDNEGMGQRSENKYQKKTEHKHIHITHPYSPTCDYKAHTIPVQNMWATYSMFWTKHANQLMPFPHATDAWQWTIFIFTLGTLLCITTLESTICNNANLTHHPMSSVCPTCQVRLDISNQWIYTAVS